MKAANKQDYSTEMQEVMALYGDDLNESELMSQVQVFSTNFELASDPITLQNLSSFYKI